MFKQIWKELCTGGNRKFSNFYWKFCFYFVSMLLGLDKIALLLLLLCVDTVFFLREESIKYELSTFFCFLFLWAIIMDLALFIFLIKSLSLDYKIFLSYRSLKVGGMAMEGNLLFSEALKISYLLEVLIIIGFIIIITYF